MSRVLGLKSTFRIWQGFMVFSLAAATVLWIRAIAFPNPFMLDAFTHETLIFASFLFLFFRFFFGQRRQVKHLIKKLEWMRSRGDESYGRFGVMAASLLLLVHGLIFVLLSAFVDRPDAFLKLFALLMLVNILWLLINYHQTKPWVEDRHAVPLFRWALNNCVFLGLVVILSPFHSQQFILAGLSLTFLNSIVDIAITWRYYFLIKHEP